MVELLYKGRSVRAAKCRSVYFRFLALLCLLVTASAPVSAAAGEASSSEYSEFSGDSAANLDVVAAAADDCGDADGSEAVDIDDVVYVIGYIFSAGPPPDPLCVGDANGDDTIDIDDVVYLIGYIFSAGPPPVTDCCLQPQMIAFTSERDGEGDIYIMNADGSDQQRLTDDPAYDAWPTWSPDGSQIAFTSTRNGNPDIYVMDADGSNVQQLTQHTAMDVWPEWSPDGTQIAFASWRDGDGEIYVIDADGTNLQRLTDTDATEDFPAWSPDGTQIVFSRIAGNDGTYIMNADGSEEWQLLDFPALEPSWSPDGTRIAFGSDHEGYRAIYVVNADGSNLQKLSTTYAGENCPDWSPDGTRITFASWRDGDGEIYLMDADGSNLQKLTSNASQDEFPAWRPAVLGGAKSGINRHSSR